MARSIIDTDEPIDEMPRDEFAEERSHEASKIASDLGKAAAQAGLLINGGAATAVIALLAKDKIDPALARMVPCSLVVYALGVAASAFMMFAAMMRAEHWNYFWYHCSYTVDMPAARDHEQYATRWDWMVRTGFAVAICSFAVASAVLAAAMAKITVR